MCKPAPAATLPAATLPAAILGQSQQLLVRTEPLAASALAGLGLSDSAVYVELESGSELYKMVVHHIANDPNTRSFALEVGKASTAS